MKVKSWPSTGIANKSNLKDWSEYAKHPTNFTDHQHGDAKLGEDWKQTQKCEEGRGWTKASETDNTYTGKNGSKRD